MFRFRYILDFTFFYSLEYYEDSDNSDNSEYSDNSIVNLIPGFS